MTEPSQSASLALIVQRASQALKTVKVEQTILIHEAICILFGLAFRLLTATLRRRRAAFEDMRNKVDCVTDIHPATAVCITYTLRVRRVAPLKDMIDEKYRVADIEFVIAISITANLTIYNFKGSGWGERICF